MAHFVPLWKLPSASTLADIFVREIVRLHGVPSEIVSDRGTQFVARFFHTHVETEETLAPVPEAASGSRDTIAGLRGHGNLLYKIPKAPSQRPVPSPCLFAPHFPQPLHSRQQLPYWEKEILALASKPSNNTALSPVAKTPLLDCFAIDEINKNPDILPNITLGYHAYDTCGYVEKAINNALQILSGGKRDAPNYSCLQGDKVAGIIGDTRSVTTLPIAQLLSVYGYPLISFGATDTLLSNKVLYPNFFRTVRDDHFQYMAILKLLKHFDWNWVGIITSGDASGKNELHELSKLLTSHKICIEFVIEISDSAQKNKEKLIAAEKTTAQIRAPGSVQLCALSVGFQPCALSVGFQPCSRDSGLYQSSFSVLELSYPLLPEDQQLNISSEFVTWMNKQGQKTRCTDYCAPGYRKAPGSGHHICCYECVPCSDGEISELTDSESCQKCPDDEWPDDRKIKCIPKTYSFLSYKDDIIAQIFTCISILFSCVTCFILGIFVYFRETPIVKSNNRNLSFLLLVCIMLSFLCVFLFLGSPVDITCRLRQTTFGIIFSIAVSSLLAKTIMVCIAFKAIKPGSHWKKWLGMKVSNSIVLICSSVQVLISVLWLSISPPFQEFDMYTYNAVIIVQCNEGSVFAFYSMLGYMGILASVSFILAYMVRSLPDSFNEAKYISFSMLVFCSVWIAMIPAYLSSKGKDMVSVEIFAILASSAGILSCIFFPKCYIMLRKPEMNTRKCVLKKNST
ncbi:vomeronasal type-2 receptor 26-like [Spea bombifrons]|uniref:vomeronasal type-2 receptor 26-like n=1 Tax=Spea bombifrons TaxID=233779 RepID=UPI00234A1718|nr:vomeronasal type-2 receptor 26-like [Spea bombifrons]